MREQMQSSTTNLEMILKVRDIYTYFYTDLGISRALNGVSLRFAWRARSYAARAAAGRSRFCSVMAIKVLA